MSRACFQSISVLEGSRRGALPGSGTALLEPGRAMDPVSLVCRALFPAVFKLGPKHTVGLELFGTASGPGMAASCAFLATAPVTDRCAGSSTPSEGEPPPHMSRKGSGAG